MRLLWAVEDFVWIVVAMFRKKILLLGSG